jgi:ABC-type transport system substrate-binding protein
VSTATVVWFTRRQVRDTVVLKSYTSLPNAVQSLVRGEIDLLPIDRFDQQTLKSIQNNSQVKLVSIPSYDFTYIGLNLRNWPLSDPRFRKTMLYALNRTELLNKVLGNLGEGLNPGLFPSAYSKSGWKRYTTDQYHYNVTSATRLLDGDGFSKSSHASFRIDPSSGEPLRTMFIMSRLSVPEDVAAADLFAKDMQAIGLPIISLPMSDFDFRLALRNYSFDMFIDSSPNNYAPTWLYTLFESKNDI